MDHNPILLKRHWWSRRVILFCVRCEQQIGSHGTQVEAAQAVHNLTLERMYQRGLGSP